MISLEDIELILRKHFDELVEDNIFKKVLEYAVFPPGKLFRPELIYALAKDLNSHSENHEYFASSIEIHHSYTLVHDDLPEMDNDDYRRGKLSTHKKFGHWQGVLAGDALLGLSYGLLSKITHKDLPELLSTYHKHTGHSGLIYGQVLDLENKVSDLSDIIEIHTLKTARLIQLCLIGTNILADNKIISLELERLGQSIGIIFQLIDDLTELTDDVKNHELEINPFLKFDSQSIIDRINKEIKIAFRVMNENRLSELENIIKRYLLKMKSKIEKGQDKISSHINGFQLEQISFS